MDRRLSPNALLKHADFTRALARHLLRDPSDADDAAQEMWRVAIERPPRAEGSVRGWFATVLRNTIRQSRRSNSRRERRERGVARPEGRPSTLDSLVREETLQRVVSAVRALAEPYRTTILLRYYEDLPPRVIAVRMDAPVETVKSRLKRARMQLRGDLESRDGAWRLALAPLVNGDALSGTTAMATMGASVMSTKLKMAAAFLVIALLGAATWYVIDDGRSAPDTDVGVGGESLLADASDETEGPALRASGRTRRLAAGAPDAPALRANPVVVPNADAARPDQKSTRRPPSPRSVVRGSVNGVVTVSGQRALGGTVRIHAAGASDVAREPVAIGSDGTFRIADAPVGKVQMTVHVEGLQPRSITASISKAKDDRVTIAFGAGVIWGVVHDELGRPAAGVYVRMGTFHRTTAAGLTPSAEGDVFRMSTTSDADGRYEFRDLPSGTFAFVAQVIAGKASHPRNIRSQQVTLNSGETRRFDIGGPHEDPTWTGSVVYADGAPIRRSGNVFLRHTDGEHRMYVGFDSEGRFSQEVPVGTYDIELVMFPDGSAFAGARIFKAGRLEVTPQGAVDSVVFPLARIAGRVSGPKPRPGQIVTITRVMPRARTTPTPKRIQGFFAGRSKHMISVRVKGDGSYVFDGLLPGTYTVTAHPRSARDKLTIVVPEGRALIKLDVALRN